MPEQFNPCVILSKSAFLQYILKVYLANTNDCVAAHVFMQSRPVLDHLKHVLHRNNSAVI